MLEKMTELAEKIGQTFLEGDVVFKQGAAGDTMFIIHTGALAVIRETEGTSTVVARLNPAVALIMGGEETGLRKGMIDRCDYLISLPMHGALSSLNVSVATGICLYEIGRQRRENTVK